MENAATLKVEEILSTMDPVTLEEMDHVKLMQRRDTKFVVPANKVPELINQVMNRYRVLEIDGKRMHPYLTLYYDTPQYEMYQNHHNGRLNRYKVRVRKYLTSNISFLEIKYKNNRSETIKKRIRPDHEETINDEKSDTFLKENSPYKAGALAPSLQNSFSRITFVHRTIPERITIDLNLSFSNIAGDETLDLPQLSVIEVKRQRDSSPSDMITLLRNNQIRATGFSKYCMGTAMMNKKVKNNLFRDKIRGISIKELSKQNT